MRNHRARIARVAAVVALVAAITGLLDRADGQEPAKPLTVKDAIEATHVLRPFGSDPVLVSPHGGKYLVVLQRGDVARNGSWVELLSGGMGSLEATRQARVVVRLFSTSTASADDLIKNVRWLDDDEHVVFLWDDGRLPARVVRVDMRTGRLETLVRRPTPVLQYDVSPDGQTIVFVTTAPRDRSQEERDERRGFPVVDQSIWALLQGHLDGWTPQQRYDTFVLKSASHKIHKIPEHIPIWLTPPELLKVSPDGRYAITVRPLAAVPTEWDQYTDHIFHYDYLPVARRNPGGPSLVRQYVLIDTEKRTTRPLWDAPENPSGKLSWCRNSKSLIIGPTFLPVSRADRTGLVGQSVAEVDVATGGFHLIPVPPDLREGERRPIRWIGTDTVEIGDTAAAVSGEKTVLRRFKKTGGNWTPIEQSDEIEPFVEKVRVELIEDPNTPPALYAADRATGHRQLIRELSPQLKHFTLGRVETVHWKAADGRMWSGLLDYPVGYQPGQSFPLVIQTHGYLANQFTLDGAFSTAFAAQVLANHGIAVLQVGGPDRGGEDFTVSPKETRVYQAGYEGAVDHFVKNGLADPEKIGIVGFSRTGWFVEYLLTHSQFPFAAAEVADNIDGSYLQYLLFDDGGKGEFEADLGARPFGEGLETWIRDAPGFNADKLKAPLRMEIDSGPIEWILSDWEMFSNLRYLQKPVELFVIPDIEHGVHLLQNPAQRLASQGGTVDWFCYWLKGERNPNPASVGEYSRWDQLKAFRN